MILIAPNHIEPGTGKLLAEETAESQGADSGKYLVHKGQVIYSKIRPNLVKAVIAPMECLCSADMYGLSPDFKKLDSEFLLKIILSKPFTDYVVDSSMRVAMPKVNHDSLGAAPVWLPPLDEQRKIVAFLDRETSKIDTLISKQKLLIATLREDRRATIANAVTKGLDPNVKMRDSGVAWVSTAPSRWRNVQVKNRFTVTVGKMLNAGNPKPGTILYPYMRAANIQPHGLDLSEVKEMPLEPHEVTQLSLRADDLVVVEGGGGYGRSAVLPTDLKGWVFQNHILRVRTKGADKTSYLDYLIKTLLANGHISTLSNHATIPSLSSEKLECIRFAIPPASEQKDIVKFLDYRCEKIDALVAKACEMIATLREYRSALITAAVTGQIDVRGVV